MAARKRKAEPRIRRTADEAKRAILDAAEARLREVGPAGLRLQEIAADVGVSHPAVLHHFGSREALVEAVVERAVTALEEELVAAFSAGAADPATVLGRTWDTLGSRGHARLMAWLSLSGFARATPASKLNWARIIDGTHAMRVIAQPDATREDTAFTVVLSALAIFGDALAGGVTFANAGLDDDARARFRDWLGGLLLDHLTRS